MRLEGRNHPNAFGILYYVLFFSKQAKVYLSPNSNSVGLAEVRYRVF